MTRDELEMLAAPLVERTFAVCQEALSVARLPVSAFDKVILVGGSTRIPLVRRRVEQFFGAPPLDRVNPDEVVAIGAAIQAAALTEVARRRSIPPRARARGAQVARRSRGTVPSRRGDGPSPAQRAVPCRSPSSRTMRRPPHGATAAATTTAAERPRRSQHAPVPDPEQPDPAATTPP